MSIKIICIWAGLALILAGLLSYKSLLSEDEGRITIGIIQTATHPALDQAREGFIQELVNRTDGEVRFILQNAEGSLSQAQAIAESYHAHKKITAIYAIGTPAVQAIARVEKRKPILISAVSDPTSLGIVYKGSNVCGTTDRVDTEAQADLILKLLPTTCTVAILYNPGENNSQVMVKQMGCSLKKRGIAALEIGVNSESEIIPAMAAASRKSDAILVPADNLIVSAMPLVAKEALNKHAPLIASDTPSVTKGALAAQGANYEDLGKQTGEIAYKVLILGEKPSDIGVVDPGKVALHLNESACAQLQIIVPTELEKQVNWIRTEGDHNEP